MKGKQMETQNLVEELNKVGIRAGAYKRPPVSKNVFALTILPRHKEGVVTVNQGRAKVEIHGDKKQRQAVVTVREMGRMVRRKMAAILPSPEKPTRGEILNELKKGFPVLMPRNTKWSILNDSALKIPDDISYRVRWRIGGIVTAQVRHTTTNHFLIGMDESRNFISPLPKKVTSVKEAHRVLRPKWQLRKGTVRQGEWFFVPCTKKQIEMLDELATKHSSRIRTYRLGLSTHTAKSSIRIRGGRKGFTYYARGYITDDRTGHHKSLFLKGWHKVVKNREATIKVDPAQRLMAQRQRATWD